MTHKQRRLDNNGYKSEAITNIGGVAILNARAVIVRMVSRTNTENTWWIDDPRADCNLTIAWGKSRKKKIKICGDYLPARIRETIWPLIDSNLWIAVVVAGETPGRIRERNQNPNSTDETAPDDVGLDMGELPQPNIHCTQEHSDAPLAVSPIPAYRVKALNESSRMPHHHSANHLSHVAPD